MFDTSRRRDGCHPNRIGRREVATTFQHLLSDGERFTQLEVDFDPRDLRSWVSRVIGITDELADCVVAPMRNRVMELVVDRSDEGDPSNALTVLRENVAGASPEQLGRQVGVSGRTITRIEQDIGCRIDTAAKVARYFCLGIPELFEYHKTPTGQLSEHARSIADLREQLVSRPGARH